MRCTAPVADTIRSPLRKAGKKQVFSGEEDAVKRSRHAAHVTVRAGRDDRQRVENDAEQRQRRHQVRLGDVLEVVVELADKCRIVGAIHFADQHRIARLGCGVLQQGQPRPAAHRTERRLIGGESACVRRRVDPVCNA